jgi:hypothetical protein
MQTIKASITSAHPLLRTTIDISNFNYTEEEGPEVLQSLMLPLKVTNLERVP